MVFYVRLKCSVSHFLPAVFPVSTVIEKALKKARTEFLEEPAPQPRLTPESLAQPLVRIDAARREPVSPETLERNNIIAGLDGDDRANAFRVLRARVLQKMLREDWWALGITSAVGGDGKSLTAANLAVSIAMDMNQTVLLVDLDLRGPSLHKAFGLEPRVGLSDYLTDRCELEECLIDPGIERLTILPQAATLEHSSEILALPKGRELMRTLRQNHQNLLVIYDMPPLLCSDDALVILPGLDASILVVQEGKSEETDIDRALDLLRGQNWLGTVLNKSARGFGHY